MPADDSLDQRPSPQAVLAARYPSWTIWFGEATGSWWALPHQDPSVEELVEARNVEELVESIEATRARSRAMWPGRVTADPTG
jgi:hypothetical protein